MKLLRKLGSFFGKVDGSRKGLIVPEELFRAMVSAVGSGTLISLMIALLEMVLSHASLIFPNPAVAGLASALLTLILDLLRRQNQGDKKVSEIPPA